MTIALTGATGFLGSHIARALAAAGHAVRGVVRTPSKGDWLKAHGVSFAKADLADADALREAFEGCDAIVSNAALLSGNGGYAEYERTNVEGAQNVLEAARDAGVKRVVWISSVAVYQMRLYRPIREDHELLDLSRLRVRQITDLTTDWRYSRTKRLAEKAAWAFAEEHGLHLTALRPGPIYGSRDQMLTQRYLASMRRRFSLEPTAGVPQVHAGDVAQAVVGALGNEESVGRSYNLAGPPISPYRVVQRLKEMAGKGPVVVPVPTPLWVAFDSSAAERDLGFSVRSLEEGLAEVWAHHGDG